MEEIDYSNKAIDKIIEAHNNRVKPEYEIQNRNSCLNWLNAYAHQPIDNEQIQEEAYIEILNYETISGHTEILDLETVLITN